MINSLRRIALALLGVSAVGVIGSIATASISCASLGCSAAAILSNTSDVVQQQPIILFAGGAAWAISIYTFWVSGLLLVMLELMKPKFLRRNTKRTKRRA